jgi:hypothetical protein
MQVTATCRQVNWRTIFLSSLCAHALASCPVCTSRWAPKSSVGVGGVIVFGAFREALPRAAKPALYSKAVLQRSQTPEAQSSGAQSSVQWLKDEEIATGTLNT